MKIVQYSDKFLEMFHSIQDKEFVCDSCECTIKPELGDKFKIQSKTMLETEGSEFLDNTNFYEDLNLSEFPEGYLDGGYEYEYVFGMSDEFLSDQKKIESSFLAEKYRVVCQLGKIIKKTIEFSCPVCGNPVTNEWFEIPECTGLIDVHADESEMTFDKLYTKQYLTKNGDEFTFNICIGEFDEKVIKFLEDIGFRENEENRLDVYFSINSYD
jgi:RNA polymerase subunit RPABC4/transcription elongation factor Spt4